MKKITSFVSISSLLLPIAAFAAENLFEVLDIVGWLLNRVIPLLITLAVIYFVWSVIQYTLGQDDETKKKARSGIITGIIGLFIIISFWGIVYLVQRTFDVGGATIEADQLPKVIY